MFPAELSGRHSLGPRPQFQICYLCGQQFGRASIAIHIPQCYSKKVAQWERGNPATRGGKPKHPDTVKWQSGGTRTNKQLNDEQFREFASNLVPCPHCARTFLPDRLPVHLRGCKGSTGAAPSAPKYASERKAKDGATPHGKGSVSPRRSPGLRPLFPTCYLCGQQFGTSSIGIHVPQCYAKKLAQWEVADPATRGTRPRHPDTVNWRGAPGSSAEEQSESQFKEFINNLEPCMHCGRRFLSDRLVVHLRSCRPGNTAKRVSYAAGPPAPNAARDPDSVEDSVPITTDALSSRLEDLERLNPMKNRLPRVSALKKPVAAGRTCPHCAVVEQDPQAKFCRDCGRNLNSKVMKDPCCHCGEAIPQGSLYCGTCGELVGDAVVAERQPGRCNENAPTVHMLRCQGCKALCCADANFCDNCGAVLGTDELPQPGHSTSEPSPPVRSSMSFYMHCSSCNERVADLSAVYCEDCGGKLERRESSTCSAQAGGWQQDAAPSPGPPPLCPSGSARPLSSAAGAGEAPQLECHNCGRSFAPEVLLRHVRICTHQKKRVVFNMTKQRLAGVESVPPARHAAAPATSIAKDWREESRAFRRAMREARHVDRVLKSGGNARDLPPPTYSENPNYVPCPHCQRRFAPDVAERHIPRCAHTLNRPKPPPKHPRK